MTLNRAFLSALVASALFSTNALASDNTITFMGEVSDETCSISVNGSDASPVVLLPTVTATELKDNQVAGATTFDVGVSGCTGSASGVEISTVFVGNNVSSSGNLTSTGSAQDVEIQILSTSGTEIDFRNAFTGTGDLSLKANETSASATYKAQYFTSGAATTGTVLASMQYAVSYQ
ncbi:fimbrial protein [Citrobacter amalonaticus]|uniref:fimbrial protein n=1 Tax=Citrobacter amalonaticus TaxID=35703 RepID=UPI00300D182A